ncbi:hypothetical protein Tco_0054166 [Tanacetum coccineum]
MVSATKDPLTFIDLMATPIDFSKYVLNGLKIKNLTQDILLGHAFNLLKGTCSSSIKLEYNFQECFNALTNNLDLNNPEGDRYPFDLSKPLPLQGPPEGNFIDLHLNDIEDMLLLAIQHKLFHLEGSVIIDFIVALRMFTRSLILKRRVEDLQLGKRVLRADELYKFSDGTLKSVRDEIHYRVHDFHLDYNPEMPKRKWTSVDRKRSGLMIELIDKQL